MSGERESLVVSHFAKMPVLFVVLLSGRKMDGRKIDRESPGFFCHRTLCPMTVQCSHQRGGARRNRAKADGEGFEPPVGFRPQRFSRQTTYPAKHKEKRRFRSPGERAERKPADSSRSASRHRRLAGAPRSHPGRHPGNDPSGRQRLMGHESGSAQSPKPASATPSTKQPAPESPSCPETQAIVHPRLKLRFRPCDAVAQF